MELGRLRRLGLLGRTGQLGWPGGAAWQFRRVPSCPALSALDAVDGAGDFAANLVGAGVEIGESGRSVEAAVDSLVT